MLTKNQKGFGVSEVLMAASIFMLAMLSIVSLVIYNVTASKISEDNLIAANLAREGLEVVRNLRDTDWLAKTSSLVSGNAIADFKIAQNLWKLTPVGDIFSENARLYQAGDVYLHDQSGRPTKFYRIVTISGSNVTSKVRWKTKGGGDKYYSLSASLANWK